MNKSQSKEKIFCTFEYDAMDNPTCRVLVNDNIVHTFTGDGKEESFSFDVVPGSFNLKIMHYGKDMKRDINKFIEIKKIFLNDVDLKNLIWDTVQVPELPEWQDSKDFDWRSNLYLGHNGFIEYKLKAPIIDFLLEYHTYGVKTSSNMNSYDMNLLNEMKDYFTKIVDEQEKNEK